MKFLYQKPKTKPKVEFIDTMTMLFWFAVIGGAGKLAVFMQCPKYAGWLLAATVGGMTLFPTMWNHYKRSLWAVHSLAEFVYSCYVYTKAQVLDISESVVAFVQYFAHRPVLTSSLFALILAVQVIRYL